MKYFFLTLGLVSAIILIDLSFKSAPKNTVGKNGVAVIELFTSQGCSSCPSADKLLGKYTQQNGDKVICLSFNVDYWNRLGWKDVYSNAAFSQRQSLYDQNLRSQTFTPQAVVNGATQFVGSDERNIDNAIASQSANTAITEIQAQQSVQGNLVSVDYTLSGTFQDCDLVACLVQNKTSTQVNAGENGGATLVEYNVVRDFKMVNGVQDKGNISLKIPADISSKDCSVVLFAQQKNQGKITGASEIKI